MRLSLSLLVLVSVFLFFSWRGVSGATIITPTTNTEQLICLSPRNILSWFNVSSNNNIQSPLLTTLLATGLRGELIGIDDRGLVLSRGGGSIRNRTIYGLSNFGELYLIDLITGRATLVLQIPGRRAFEAITNGMDIDPITGRLVLSRSDRLTVLTISGGSQTTRDSARLQYEDDDSVVVNPRRPNIVALAYAPVSRGGSLLYAIDAANSVLSLLEISPSLIGSSIRVSITGVARISVPLSDSYVSLDILHRIPRGGDPSSYFAVLSVDTPGSTNDRRNNNFYSLNLANGRTAIIAAPISLLYRRLRLDVLSCTFFQPPFFSLGDQTTRSSTTTGGQTSKIGQTTDGGSTTGQTTDQTTTGGQTTDQTTGGGSQTNGGGSLGSGRTTRLGGTKASSGGPPA